MFSPGPNILGFTTGGVERMRIDASGNVTIGNTPVAGVNSIVQSTMTFRCDEISTTADILADGSVPQSDEGDLVFDVTITPTDASNALLINVRIKWGDTTGNRAVIAVFKDSDANAAFAEEFQSNGTVSINNLTVAISTPAASTSAQTWMVRFGDETGGDIKLNRSHNISNPFGAGRICSSIEIREIQL